MLLGRSFLKPVSWTPPRAPRALLLVPAWPVRTHRALDAGGRVRVVPCCSDNEMAQVKLEGPIPEGVSVEIKGAEGGSGIEYDQETKTLRLPLSAAGGGKTQAERRSKLVIFTCNKCDGRTARNVNPLAWENGMVMCQCGHCEVWHMLSAKNKNLYEEILYDKEEAAAIRAAATKEREDAEDKMNNEAGTA